MISNIPQGSANPLQPGHQGPVENNAKPIEAQHASKNEDEIAKDLEDLGKAAIGVHGEDGERAMKELVSLATNGGRLREQACGTLRDICEKTLFGHSKPDSSVMKRIQSVGARALEAIKPMNQAELREVPTYLLQVAGQQATAEREFQLAENIGKELNARLSPDQADAKHWLKGQAAALEELKGHVSVGTYGKMQPGHGVVELTATPMNEANRNGMFHGLGPGQQKPVTFKVGSDYVHGFLRLDDKKNQHICVLNTHVDQPKFMDNFMTALGLPPGAHKSASVDVDKFKGLSEASLAEWLFAYCAEKGGTLDNIKKFSQHVADVTKTVTIDFLQASRVAARKRAQASEAKGPVLTVAQPVGKDGKEKKNAEAHAAGKKASQQDFVVRAHGMELKKVEKQLDEPKEQAQKASKSELDGDKRLEIEGKESLKIEGKESVVKPNCLSC